MASHRFIGWCATLLLTLCASAQAAQLTGDPQPDPQYPPAMAELTILSNGSRMPALLYQANGAGPHPTVLLLHGFPGNEKNLDIAQVLRRDGFNVLFFHYRGAWGAEGDYSINQLDDDVLAALAFLRNPANAAALRINSDRLSLLGHSLGGFTALAAGSQDAKLTCVGAMAPANVALWKMGVDTEDKNSMRLLAYANSLFMLKGFGAQAMLEQLRSAPLEAVDTRAFGPGLKGKSVFMIVGDEDRVTAPASMFKPVVAEYRKVSGLKLESHIISGDHAFSWSRLALTELIRQWLLRDCH
jgi:pimeloyl-ACP methyl ester carboxylesterase